MRLLLDTHVLLWWLEDNPTLSTEARAAIGDGCTTVYVSAVTAWEISINKALRKLVAPKDLAEALAANRFEELPISITHGDAAGSLPMHHTDPIDRTLVAQALTEDLEQATRDEHIAAYGVSVLHA